MALLTDFLRRRVLPMRHPSAAPNVAPGLLDALGALSSTNAFSGPLPMEDLVADVAGVVSHPGYPARFADELSTPAYAYR